MEPGLPTYPCGAEPLPPTSPGDLAREVTVLPHLLPRPFHNAIFSSSLRLSTSTLRQVRLRRNCHVIASASLLTFIRFLHLVGLALAMGAATIKLSLLLKARAVPSYVPAYLAVARPITRQIIAGIVVLALSGIWSLVLGYPFTPKLAVKLAMVAAILVLGPVIDNVIEPRFRALAPAAGEPPSPAFVLARRRYLVVEALATLLFYAILVLWLRR